MNPSSSSSPVLFLALLSLLLDCIAPMLFLLPSFYREERDDDDDDGGGDDDINNNTAMGISLQSHMDDGQQCLVICERRAADAVSCNCCVSLLFLHPLLLLLVVI